MKYCKKCDAETERNSHNHCKCCALNYRNRPEVKERYKAYQKDYFQRPEVKAYRRKYMMEYMRRDDVLLRRQRKYEEELKQERKS